MAQEDTWIEQVKEIKQKYEQVPYWKHLGIKAEAISQEVSAVALEVDPAIHTNYHGTVHGGIYASILDNAMALAIKSFDTSPVVTTQMSIQFLSAASEGTIRAYGRLIHRTERTFTVQGEVRDQEGSLLAYATASFLKVKTKQA